MEPRSGWNDGSPVLYNWGKKKRQVQKLAPGVALYLLGTAFNWS